jgi:hypothetical protein
MDFIDDSAFSNCESIATVNYKGSIEQWSEIMIGYYNDYLIKATRNYNYTE